MAVVLVWRTSRSSEWIWRREDAGFDVIQVSSADEAIAILEVRLYIDTVFTDIEMPGFMDGLKLAFAVRDRWPPVNIIIASGRIRPQAYEMPADAHFLRKPYSHAAVTQAVSALSS